MSWLLSVYIGAAVFGIGVTLVDLFGLLGSHDGDHDGSHDGTNGHETGDHAEYGFGDHAGDHVAAENPPELDTVAGLGGDQHGAEAPAHDGSVVGYDRPGRRSFLLGLLRVVRNVIYFCLGFGPVGWFALERSGSVLTSLIWSAPVGIAALIGTRALRRFMRRELNSEISSDELLLEGGVVTVSIGPGEMGKVRIKLGDVYVERYARAASPEIAIHVGTSVRVTDVDDDCVYVEEE